MKVSSFSPFGKSYSADEGKATGELNSRSVSNTLNSKLKSRAMTLAKVAIAVIGLITLVSAVTLTSIFVSPLAGAALGVGVVGAVILISAGIFLAKEESKEKENQKTKDGDSIEAYARGYNPVPTNNPRSDVSNKSSRTFNNRWDPTIDQ